MCKKLVFLTIATLVVAPAIVNAASQGPVGWWKFDDASGTTAVDSAGGRNGTLLPAGGEPVWVDGKVGGALQFAGGSAPKPYVELPIGDLISKLSNTTFSLWVNWTGAGMGGWQRIFDFGSGQPTYAFLTANAGGGNTPVRYAIRTNSAGESTVSAPSSLNISNAWHHIAIGVNANTARNWLYIDGLPVGNSGTNYLPKDLGVTTQNWVARSQYDWDAYFGGLVDDLRIYDRFLSADDVMNLMNGGPGFGVANSPVPANKATEILATGTTLSWTAGATAVKHDVYFGTDAADLKSVRKGTTATTYDPGKLAFGTTYYWRVDEADVNGVVIVAGNVWSFKTELLQYKIASVTATASSEVKDGEAKKTVDNSGIDANDLANTNLKAMWQTAPEPNQPVTIQYDFDKVYKMAEMWVWNFNSEFELDLGYGLKDVTIEYSVDNKTWTKLGNYTFEQAPAEEGYAHNTTIAFNGVAAKNVKITAKNTWGDMGTYGLSEVRFFYTPALASAPSPANNSTGFIPGSTMTWRPGRTATLHRVFLSTDQTAVKNGTVAPFNVFSPSFTPADLQLDGTVYYWRVEEVNPKDTVKTWAGDVWKFTTASYLTVDDMEGYSNDTDSGKAIYQTWSANSTAKVGYPTEPYAEKVAVHGGSQSMPFFYTLTGSKIVAEATRKFDPPQNWTLDGTTTLVIFFRGDPNNTGGQFYIKVNGVKVPYYGALTVKTPVPLWQQWNVSLADIVDITGGVEGIKSLTIGVTGTNVQGALFIDDIRVYKTAPALAAAINPGSKNMVGYYAMSDNVKDGSGSGNDGTLVGAPTFTDGLKAFGKALNLNGTTDCVDLGQKDVWNFTGSFSVSLWANIGNWGSAWTHVMIGNRGEDNKGWQIRRGSGTSVCFTTRGLGSDDSQGSAPPLNQWVNIACVYDSVANTKTLYINGASNLVQNTNAGAKLTPTTHNTYIGARANGGNTAPEALFTGMLDEIRVYSGRALTAGEVLYLAGGR